MNPELIPLAILPVVAGYLFSRILERTRYRLARIDGQHLYLSSAIAGFFISLAIYSGILAYVTCSTEGLSLPSDFYDPNYLLATFILAPIISPVVALLLNLFSNKFKHWELSLGELEALCLRAIMDGSPVMVTLEDQKVYVGFINQIRPQREDQWIQIRPLLSGYRDSKHRVEYTVNYADAFVALSARNDIDESALAVAIPCNRIVSARRFDFSLASEFTDSDNVKQSSPNDELN